MYLCKLRKLHSPHWYAANSAFRGIKCKVYVSLISKLLRNYVKRSSYSREGLSAQSFWVEFSRVLYSAKLVVLEHCAHTGGGGVSCNTRERENEEVGQMRSHATWHVHSTAFFFAHTSKYVIFAVLHFCI